MVIGILQPGYLPWLGFFEQMYKSDTFVIYDDVQYDKGSWRNRNRIKTANGIQWLTVPVRLKFEEHTTVNKVLVDNTAGWEKKHLFSIKQNYSKALFFKSVFPVFEEGLSRKWEYLIDLDMFFIEKFREMLGLKTPIFYSSSLGVSGGRFERLIKICKHFGADVFYEGAAGKDYIDPAIFSSQNISVRFQDYRHPSYKQLHGEFVPFLSIVDLLFNYGEDSLKLLTSQTAGGEKS
jgi:hypothetical protein